MKNINGYGTVVKLSGKRRKTYAIRITTGWQQEYDLDGTPVGKPKQKYKYLNYYEDRKDALFDLFSDTGSDDDHDDSAASEDGHEGTQHDDLGAPFSGVLPPEGVNLKDMVSQIEIDMIKQALAATDGVVARAAEILQMRRTTLVEKIKKYGISQDTE